MTLPTVFLSYSRKDGSYKDELVTHLEVLAKAGLIDLWNDDRIRAGAAWRPEIQAAMERARVALLLVTANFLTSDFILNEEIPELLRRREHEGLTVLPIIAQHCLWQEVDWLAKIHVLPRHGQPVWRDNGQFVHEDLTQIAKEVSDLLKATKQPTGAPAEALPAQEIDLTIATPDGQRFAATVPREYPISEVIRDLLEQWPHATSPTPRRYALHNPAWDEPRLDASLSLREAGLRDGCELTLTEEPLEPKTPVGLTVEDAAGARYTTAVRLDTRVARLAREFLGDEASAGNPIVELLSDGSATLQTLDPESSLYDQGIGDGARLRVYRAREHQQGA